MDIDIAYFSTATSTANGPFGYGRTLSTNLTAQASGSPLLVTMTRGDGSMATFTESGVGTGVFSSTVGVFSSLTEDTTDSLWKETDLNGRVTAYPLDTTGALSRVAWVQDAVGNTHTFAYASNKLATVQDSVGRFVSLSYDGNSLLASVQDGLHHIQEYCLHAGQAQPFEVARQALDDQFIRHDTPPHSRRHTRQALAVAPGYSVAR